MWGPRVVIRWAWALAFFAVVIVLQLFSGAAWPVAVVGAAPIALAMTLLTGLRPSPQTNPLQNPGLFVLVLAYALLLPPFLGLARPERLTVGLVLLGIGYAAFLMGILVGRRGPGDR